MQKDTYQYNMSLFVRTLFIVSGALLLRELVGSWLNVIASVGIFAVCMVFWD